jgi:plasmid stabilization system protein ParE
MTLYEVSAEAQDDLFGIWSHIAEDSVELANRIDSEFHALFASLGRMPGQGHIRKDLTTRPVRFFPLYSYLVIYQPDVKPTRIMAVLRGKRNVKRILRERT